MCRMHLVRRSLYLQYEKEIDHEEKRSLWFPLPDTESRRRGEDLGVTVNAVSRGVVEHAAAEAARRAADPRRPALSGKVYPAARKAARQSAPQIKAFS